MKRARDTYETTKEYWRYGQVLFNTLLEFDDKLAKEIRGSNLDPFFTQDKEKIDNFLKHVQTKWSINE